MTRTLTQWIVFALVLVSQASGQSLLATWQQLELSDGSRLTYKLGLPEGFDGARTYPLLLALPPGSQTRALVDASWQRYWAEQAASRGWIVVSPVAPEGRSFHDGGERVLPELLEALQRSYRVEHGRVHLTDVSNGGRGAFRAATRWPGAFLSLTVLPGYPPSAEDEARLGVLARLPVSLYAGGDDTHWVERMQATAARLRDLGVDVTATVLPGEGHTPPSLDGDTIMLRLEAVRAQVDAALSEDVMTPRGSGPAGGVTATADDASTQRSATTTVLVVRHADREGHGDALSVAGHARAEALARLLESAALDALIASEYQRTHQTLAPTARAHQLTPRSVPARDDLATLLLAEHAGQTVLVAGHSNTVPEIVAGLGVSAPIVIPEDRYGDLFVVTIRDGQAELLRLRY